MKVLGLNSLVSLGDMIYKINKIDRKSISLVNTKSGRETIYELKDLEDNLNSGVMKVCTS